MIDRAHELPVVRQASLLQVSRSSAYSLPRPVPPARLAVMHRIDALHLEQLVEDPVHPREDGARGGVDGDQRADGRAHLGHHRRGGHAPAHNVAHEQRDAAVLEREHVVEVAAGVRATRRVVGH